MPLSEAQAKKNLQALIEKYKLLSADDRKQMSEASVVRQFIDILLRDVLGWPIEDPARYRYEQVTQVGRPDMMLTPERGGTIFIEAKRFGAIEELKKIPKGIRGVITPEQMALPGMAVDRTPQEQQAINYAFANNGTWAILTNFERLRLFNARRDWLVLSFEGVEFTSGDTGLSTYLTDFDLLWQLAYHNILQGSLESLNNQRHVAEVDTDYLNFINEWREVLAQDILNNRESNPWAFSADGGIDLPTLRAVVQRVIDRLVIIRFAEDHLVVPPGTLRGLYEVRQQNMYTDLDQMLDTLFKRFGKAHDSALFEFDQADQATFSDETLIALLKKLYDAKYRSMPADIMGNTYEQYLGKTLVQRNGSIATADNLETRKKQGSYYTPQVIVRYIVDNSLGRYLYGTQNGQPDGEPVPGETRKTSADIRDLRVLDGACGSGSFLIYAYQVLDAFYESESTRLQSDFEKSLKELSAQGMLPNDSRIELSAMQNEMDRIANRQRLILETHLYGVDLDPQAAEIAVVNLVMRGMERRYAEKRLPLILKQNVKVGNSLVGLRPDDPAMADHARQLALIRQLRADLISTPHDDPKHHAIIAALNDATRELNDALNVGLTSHFDDLSVVRPFHWGIEFPEVFYDAEGKLLDNPGFTVIFGNPPWEILEPDLREFYAQFDADIGSRLSPKGVEMRIEQLNSEDPYRRTLFEMQTAFTRRMAAYFSKAPEYHYQGKGKSSTQKLFLERVYTLLKHLGRVGFVIPAGIYRDLGTKELREMLLKEGSIQYAFSFSNERGFFHGVHHDSRFTLLGAQKGPQADGFWSVFRFNPRLAVAPEELTAFLSESTNLIYVRRETLAKFSPDSLSLMEFQSKLDYEVAERIYGTWPLVGESQLDNWDLQFTQEFNMTTDRALFNTIRRGYALYEGKMIHQYDAFYAPPRYWIDESLGVEQLKNSGAARWHEGYRFAFREVSNATNERTCIAAVLPPKTFAGHTLWVGVAPDYQRLLQYLAIINSFCVDWIARFKVDKHVTLFVMKQLPVPRLNPGNPYFDAIVPRAARLTCTRVEFADLWQAVMGESWDESKGATDPAERQRLRDEIDAIVAHLYGLSREDFDHILGTFPLVFPDNDAGRARRESLLGVFEAWER